jgi:hypothetical protein
MSIFSVPRFPRNFREVWEVLEISAIEKPFCLLFCPVLKGVLIMALLPLMTCAQLLGIHPKTLHSWLKEANLPLACHPTDARIKCLEQQYLQEVAKRHDRSLPEQASVLVLPEEQVASLPSTGATEPDLMQKLSSLEAKVASLQEHLTTLALALLAEREGTLERRLATLEVITAELVGGPIVAAPLPHQLIDASTRSTGAARSALRTLNPAEQQARLRLPPLIEYGADGRYVIMSSLEGELSLLPESAEWFEWLASISSFRFVGQSGRLTAYRETKGGKPTRSWSAHRSIHQQRYKRTLGVTDRLTIAWLEHTAALLQANVNRL